MRNHLHRLVLVIASVLAAPAHAQWSPDATMDLGMGYGNMALSQSSLQGTRSIGAAGERAFARKPSRAAGTPAPAPRAADLRYVPTAKVSELVNRRFIEWQAAKRPQLRAQIAQGIHSGELQRYFRGLVTRRGFSPTDLADISTVYYISLWQVLHGREVSAAQAASVRRQMRDAMAQEPRLTSLTDAQQQEIAETFALHTALALQGYQQIVRSGNTTLLRDFRSGLQRTLVPQGPDLASLTITDQGFTRR